MEQQNNSEVARILAQMREQYQAATLGLSGLSLGSSQHKFITNKMERIAELHEQLQELAGAEAMELVAETLDLVPAPVSPAPS